MARSQTWTRNIPKKKGAGGGALPSKRVVDDGALEGLKRRAEDLGLILHARPRGKKQGGVSGRKKSGGK
jgi:hypothetical protein